MSASDVIARLRVAYANASMDEDDEITRAFPALLECAEAVQKIHDHLIHYIDARDKVDVSVAVVFGTARAALQALAEGGGE